MLVKLSPNKVDVAKVRNKESEKIRIAKSLLAMAKKAIRAHWKSLPI